MDEALACIPLDVPRRLAFSTGSGHSMHAADMMNASGGENAS